jgi:hypothetical protein
VIELNAENLRRIVCDEPCVRSVLHFDDMFCLMLEIKIKQTLFERQRERDE